MGITTAERRDIWKLEDYAENERLVRLGSALLDLYYPGEWWNEVQLSILDQWSNCVLDQLGDGRTNGYVYWLNQFTDKHKVDEDRYYDILGAFGPSKGLENGWRREITRRRLAETSTVC